MIKSILKLELIVQHACFVEVLKYGRLLEYWNNSREPSCLLLALFKQKWASNQSAMQLSLALLNQQMRMGSLQATAKYDCRLIIGLKQVPLQWSPFLHIVLSCLFRILGLREVFSTRTCIKGSTKIVIFPLLPAKLRIPSNVRNNLKLSQSYFVEGLHLSEINLPPA